MSDLSARHPNADTLSATGHNAKGDWRPAETVPVAPINHWPPNAKALSKWFFGFPGYIWPSNLICLLGTLAIWIWATPALTTMAEFELWWVGLLLLRNLALFLVLFGGLHFYLYIAKGQGDHLRFTLKSFAKDSGRFHFRNQVFDNVFRNLVYAVPILTLLEAVSYWGFANGSFGLAALFGLELSGLGFWIWAALLIILTPIIHSIHFYFIHRLVHVRFLYRTIHAVHHHNIEIGPWSGLAMHPVEIFLYFSSIMVHWIIALHPFNALFQIYMATYYAALAHTGFDKVKLGGGLQIDAGSYYHYLHHKYFECNYGGSVVALDKLFGTYHDGSDEALKAVRQRLKTIRAAEKSG